MKTLLSTKSVFLAASLLLLLTGCKSPYVEITYTLSCSKNLLEYVVPVVTYKNDKGNAVTFNVPESEWEDAHNDTKVNTNVTNISENGEETTTESLSTSLLNWTKIVSYDDFTLVDDELTVRYQLKEGVTADMLPSRILSSHQLTYFIELRDEDKTMHYKQSTDGITVGTAKVEDVLGAVDYRGFRIMNTGQIEEKEYKVNK